MSFQEEVQEILDAALQEELAPLLRDLVAGQASEVSQALQGEVTLLAQRLASAAARGDQDGLRLLRGAGKLILDKHAIRASERQAAAIDAVVAVGFRVLAMILAKPWFVFPVPPGTVRSLPTS